MKKGRFMIMGLLSLSILLAVSPLQAEKKDTLVIGCSDVFSTLDHYQSILRATIQLSYMVWDSLITPNPDTGEIVPGLARSWKVINPTTSTRFTGATKTSRSWWAKTKCPGIKRLIGSEAPIRKDPTDRQNSKFESRKPKWRIRIAPRV